MPLDAARARQLLSKFEFEPLFIEELGWDRYAGRLEVALDGDSQTLRGVAEKRGMVAFVADLGTDALESAAIRRRIEQQVARSVHEHLIIFIDESRSSQLWQWVRREPGRPAAFREHRFYEGQPGESLIQKLDALMFSLDEEPGVTIVDVTRRARAAFDVERVTKRFYERFKVEHDLFLDFIRGMPRQEDREWYASVMLNRLMFVYFIQKKGFLDQDRDYLRNRLRAMQTLRGRDEFHSFYRHFLLRLFHEGLGERGRSSELDELLGDVPYLNGGLFSLHELERANPDILISDEAFERLFDFFDAYQWHLDDRPLRADNEINPEVLGYIFEQYVNQKEMGAYYTKEDVTGYMSAFALAPVFVNALERAIGSGPWEALREEPGRFILKALLHGLEAPLPTPQEEGDSPPASVALPGESWPEVADRREYAKWLLDLCASGAVTDTQACTKLNLNLPELTVAFVALIDQPQDLLTAYTLLRELTVLDPTCGSGAFLFAALRLLATLYDVVLDRAEELVRDGRDTDSAGLGALLDEMRGHPSREYFVLKTAVLSNLYGVDLMEEATEIARLRLFLALVARLNSRDELEPLPDLDLNIRAGNLLVGVIDTADAERRFEGNILALEALPEVRERASGVAETYREFVRKQQADQDVADLKERLRLAKHDLAAQLDELYIATLGRTVDRDAWRASHQPFHWLIEFPQAIERGGFDVVVGNPPYIRTSRLEGYEYSGFTTDHCPDIFAPCMERASQLVRIDGGFAMIVPIAFQFSKDYDAAREAIARELPSRFASTYSRNPSALFTAGLGVRSTVVIGRRGGAGGTCCTDTRRWVEDFRPFLFETNRYTEVPTRRTTDPWPRLGHEKLVQLYQALLSRGGAVGDSFSRAGHKLGFKQTALYYLSVFVDEPPAWDQQGNRVAQTKVGTLTFASETERDVAFVLLAGRLGVWWWGATGDDFDVTTGLLASFPISLDSVRPAWPELAALAAELRVEQPKHPIVTLYAGKEMGNYDMSRCRHITDRADRVVLRTLELEQLWPYVLLADARLAKATGERPGTEREWPFAWSPSSS